MINTLTFLLFDRAFCSWFSLAAIIITIFSNKWGWIVFLSLLVLLILNAVTICIGQSIKLRRLDLSDLSNEIQYHLKWAPVIVFYPIPADNIARNLDGMSFVVMIMTAVGFIHKFWWGLLIGLILYILLKILAQFINPFISFNNAKKLNKDYNKKIMHLIEAMKFLYGESPLVIGYFANMGIDISSKDSSIEKPELFINKVQKTDLESVNKIIEEDKANETKSTTLLSLTPLLKWVKQNNTEKAKKIVGKVKDINIKDNEGNTCLIIAAMNNNLDIVDLLLKNEADVNIVNNKGENALLCIKYPEIVNIVNNEAEKTLFCKRCFKIAELLLDCGIDIEQKNNEECK